MNWLTKIFKNDAPFISKNNNKNSDEYFEALEDFKVGKKLFKEFVFTRPLHIERIHQKTMAALEFFDKAIEKGYDEAEVFLLRAMCLRDLHYDLEAYRKAA